MNRLIVKVYNELGPRMYSVRVFGIIRVNKGSHIESKPTTFRCIRSYFLAYFTIYSILPVLILKVLLININIGRIKHHLWIMLIL